MSKEPINRRVAFEYGYAVRVGNEKAGQYPVFGSNGVTGYIDNFKEKGPGVIIGRKGSVGKVVYSEENFTPTDTSYFLRILDTNRDCLKFWYYFLSVLGLEKLNTHSAVPGLSRELAYLIEVQLPKIETQQKIAAVLTALDAKIDCNNRINAELETMARTLYDYWFVQFDFPDTNGNPYKTAGGKMTYNPTLKREIPAGWKVVRINELLQGCTDSITAAKVMSGFPYTPIDALPMKKMSFGASQPASEANTSLIKYKENDILIGAMRVYFHRVCIAPFDGITRTTVIVLRPKKSNYLPYLYQLCNEERTINTASKISVGTQQPYVNWEGALENHAIPYPEDDTLIEKYSTKMQSVVKDVINRERENAHLAQLRDWLLPLLMNGQVTPT